MTQDKINDHYYTELNFHMATSLKGQRTNDNLEKYLQSKTKSQYTYNIKSFYQYFKGKTTPTLKQMI